MHIAWHANFVQTKACFHLSWMPWYEEKFISARKRVRQISAPILTGAKSVLYEVELGAEAASMNNLHLPYFNGAMITNKQTCLWPSFRRRQSMRQYICMLSSHLNFPLGWNSHVTWHMASSTCANILLMTSCTVNSGHHHIVARIVNLMTSFRRVDLRLCY